MLSRIFVATVLVGTLGMPIISSAQEGAAAGAVGGAVGGAIVGGPVGAAVGGVGGAIVGGLSDQNRGRFREYTVRERRPSYRYSGEVVVGAELPTAGVEYYDVPAEYGIREYRYTIVNDRPVLVEPRSRRIIQVID